jgi:hypothetical protein
MTGRATREPLRAPVLMVDFELGQPWPRISRSKTGDCAWVRLLVRLHRSPIGLVYLPLDKSGIAPDELRETVEPLVAEAAAAHHREYGCPPVTPGAPATSGLPLCLAQLERVAKFGPSLTVVIPTRNRAARLAGCIASILETGYHDLEIIVVDNAPSGPETELLIAGRSEWKGSVRYIREDRASSPLARNSGLAASTSEIVAFVDDDVLVDPGWPTALASEFIDSPGTGCVTGPIVAAEMATQAQLWLEEYGGFAKGFVRNEFSLAGPRPSPLFPYAAGRFGSGANMAFRRPALVEIGGFDLALGGGAPARGGEDLAAFFTIIARGRRLIYQPRMLVQHFHHREYVALRRVMLGYGLGLGAYLMKTVYDRPARLMDIAGRLPQGIRYLLASDSVKNRGLTSSYPTELRLRELCGLGLGPFAYLIGRAEVRRRRSAATRS